MPDLVAGVIVVALNFYVLLGGADFGGGVWDLLASGPRKARQRELVAHAIGPVWEANHVWLILAIVLLFTCFAEAFARVAVALHIPLSLVLIGIVLRGSAFSFRSYGAEHDEAQHRWGRTFAVASLVTPLLLGVCVGSLASGNVQPVTGEGGRGMGEGFAAAYIRPWLTPFALSVGLFTLVAFAFLAAVYLTLETTEEDLREDFRRRALGSAIMLFFAAALALLLSALEAPLVWRGLVTAPWAWPLHALTAVTAITALLALRRRAWRAARMAAAAQVSLILWGWALAQYPFLVPPDLTIADAAAPVATVRLVLIALALGAAVLFPSLYYLLRVFKGSHQPSAISRQPSANSHHHGTD